MKILSALIIILFTVQFPIQIAAQNRQALLQRLKLNRIPDRKLAEKQVSEING